VERTNGESTFRRLESDDLSEWLEDYALGELWQKNVLGGRPRGRPKLRASAQWGRSPFVSRVVVIVEGATEESFVKGPLAEMFWPRRVYFTLIILGVPGQKGGRTNYERVRKDLLRQLKQDPTVYCSTMIDFYGLGRGFPGTPPPPYLANIRKVEHIERAVKDDICGQIPESRPDLRLIPYLSLHEYEGLLFSDPDAFAHALKQPTVAHRLHQIRNDFPTGGHR